MTKDFFICRKCERHKSPMLPMCLHKVIRETDRTSRSCYSVPRTWSGSRSSSWFLGRMGYLRRRGYYVLSRLVPEFVARFGFMLSGWCQLRTRTRTCIHVRRYLLERVSKPLPFPRTYFLCAGLLARQMPRVPHYLCEPCRSPSCHQRDGLHKGAAIMLHAWNDIGTFKLHVAMLHKPLLHAKPIDLSKLGCLDCWFTPCWHHSCIASTFDRAQGRGMSTTSFLARALIRLRRCIKVLTSGKEREWLVPSLFSNYQASSPGDACFETTPFLELIWHVVQRCSGHI